MGIIVAIGGYRKKNHDDSPLTPLTIGKEIVRLSKKKSPRVLYIPTASNDSEKHCMLFEKRYRKNLRCETDILLLIRENPSYNEIKKKIDAADIIYVGGGNTLRMMNLWKRIGVDHLLRNAYENGSVMCGVSAGSICWFNSGVSDSRQFNNPDSNEYINVSGLGLIGTINCPHYKSEFYDKGYRSESMQRIVKKAKGICIAVPDGCAIGFVEDEYRIIGNKKNAIAFKCYWHKGEYIQEELKKSKKFKPISKLLKKD